MLLALRRRLRDRPDTEHEQAFVRLALTSLVALYFAPEVIGAVRAPGSTEVLFTASLGVLVANALGIFAHIVLRPAASVNRRLYGAISDIGAVSYFLWLSGLTGLPLTLLYVWITIANGFRFGPRYLMLSAGLTLIGFGTVIAIDPWWQAHVQMGIAMLLVTGVLSTYVLTLVRKNFEAIARAEAANTAKRRFVSNISHEMRTPLNAVVNLSQLLSQTELKRDQRELLDTLSSASQVLLQLVNDVLDFSKIEAGKLQIERIPFDLHAFVNSTCRMFRPQAELKGLRLQIAVMPQVPHALIGDPHHLRQVLMNLLGNAMKFTERGSVALEVDVLHDAAEQVTLRFAVRDTGIGMNKQALARVFESFSQAEASISRKFGGTGLGTTIAKQLVELMGGRMGVESTEGRGSTFWFEVPLAKSTVAVDAAVPPSLGGAILLVACDEPMAARMSAVFAPAGSKVEGVARIEEAAVRSERSEPAIRCVLVHVSDASAAQAVAATYHASTRRDRPPLVLCADNVSASERSVYLAVGYASIVEPGWSDALIFNAVRSVVVTETAPADDAPRSGTATPQSALKILVVDDTAMNLIVAKKVLVQAGHTAICVGSGEEALEALEREQYGFDVVITDLHMPGIDGLALTRSIRLLTRGSSRHIPVIVLTADVTPEARIEVIAAGADTMLGKPINAKEMLRTIVELNAIAPRARPSVATPDGSESTSAPRNTVTLIDPEVLASIASLDDRGGLVGRLIERYVRETQRAVDACRQAAARNDLCGVRAAAEEVLGLAASVGARAMIEACALSAMPHERSHPRDLHAFADRLQRRFAQTLGALDSYLANRAPAES